MQQWITYWEPYIPTMIINYYPYRVRLSDLLGRSNIQVHH